MKISTLVDFGINVISGYVHWGECPHRRRCRHHLITVAIDLIPPPPLCPRNAMCATTCNAAKHHVALGENGFARKAQALGHVAAH